MGVGHKVLDLYTHKKGLFFLTGSMCAPSECTGWIIQRTNTMHCINIVLWQIISNSACLELVFLFP